MPHSFGPLYSQLGLGLAIVNVLLDQIGLPIPAVPLLVVAGAIAVDHYGWGAELFVGATLACVLPDAGWYVAGRIYGSKVLKLLCYLSLTPDSCVSDTQQRFARWGGNALVVAKFVPGIATIAPPMAGALQMPWSRFLVRSTLGAALWVGTYLCLGMLFHEQIDRLLPRAANLGGAAIAVIAALLVGYIVFKWWERRRFYATLRMARISVSELYDQMEAERAPVVVDVRSHSARAMEPRWIPGALHLPPDELNVHLGELPRDREIVLYCNCPNEASAAQAAKLLMNLGFTRVRPLHGGLDAWVAAGYAVATAPPGEIAPRAA